MCGASHLFAARVLCVARVFFVLRVCFLCGSSLFFVTRVFFFGFPHAPVVPLLLVMLLPSQVTDTADMSDMYSIPLEVGDVIVAGQPDGLE